MNEGPVSTGLFYPHPSVSVACFWGIVVFMKEQKRTFGYVGNSVIIVG